MLQLSLGLSHVDVQKKMHQIQVDFHTSNDHDVV